MDKSQLSDGPVVAIESIGGSSMGEEFSPEMVQSGDVIEEIRISSSPAVKAPFKGGRAALQKILHAALKRGNTSVVVGVRRGPAGPERERKELRACIVPHGKRNYVLRSVHDPNHVVGFADRMESECIALQGSRSTRLVSELTKAHIQEGFIEYQWEKKMNSQALSNYNDRFTGGSYLSILALPKERDSSSYCYDAIEETMSRAHTWLLSSCKSGIPITLVNVQTETLLTKLSGEMAYATVNCINDLMDITNQGIYGFEDYHGVDLGVVTAVRLWYRPISGEIPIEIKLNHLDTRLGFSVSCTDEGFIIISSVEEDNRGDDAPSTRCGLRDLYMQAKAASQLLTISRIDHEKVLPSMICSTGSIRCYDTISVSQKLSLHRKASLPFSIHVLMWTNSMVNRVSDTSAEEPAETVPEPRNNVLRDEVGSLKRETIGDVSFRFEDVMLPSSWV